MNRWRVERAGGPGWYQPGWFATYGDAYHAAWFATWDAALAHAQDWAQGRLLTPGVTA